MYNENINIPDWGNELLFVNRAEYWLLKEDEGMPDVLPKYVDVGKNEFEFNETREGDSESILSAAWATKLLSFWFNSRSLSFWQDLNNFCFL